MIAQVCLTDAAHAVDQIFDYRIPPELLDRVQPGCRVLVPFGVHNASAEAVVLKLTTTSDFPRLKSIQQALDPTPVCTEEQLQLCAWMQKRYLASFQQCYKLIKPPYMGTKVRNWLVLLTEEWGSVTPTQEALLQALRDCGGVAELAELEAQLNKKTIRRTAYALQEKGLLTIEEKINETITPKWVRKAELSCSVDEGYALAEELFARRATVQANMVLTLCDSGALSTGDLVLMSDGNYGALQALHKKGIIHITRETVEREVYQPDAYTPSAPYTPTAEQQPIIDHLNHLISHNLHEKILLRGVTGSGKTEVFLQAIQTCIQDGKQAIMLVPEISLTPQMVERFVSRFGTSVAVMHSGLSQGERFDQWHKIRDGKVQVVVGARSAVLAPFDNLGIIILDEEHESSYKSELAPRYHARDIAFYRGQKHGAPVLLASATPSVVSYYRAKEGQYRLFEMHQRFNQNALPTARIVDMRSELLDYHNMSPISLRLQDEIRRNLERKEKTILFLNRRGYNTFVSCRECGYVLECPHCSIAMTYHRKTDQLVCHYCGHTQENVTTCPDCGSSYIRFFGTGTQKIEADLLELFPEARILRMDHDTTSGKGGHEAILSQFRNGNADILLGTQMVTKGLDFPDVTLVGVLAADASLHLDDFRAGERCFSLITQVCGRAGRGDLTGRAVIQTYQPENTTIQYAKAQAYPEFYENEIRYRKRMQYPPFYDIVYLLLSGQDEKDLQREIQNMAGLLRQHLDNDGISYHMLGPAPAPVAKIKNQFRYRLLLKIERADLILPFLRELNNAHNQSREKNTLIIDINPINML